MLQLNHRCLMFNCFNRLNKNFALHFNFSSKFWIKIMNGSFHLSLELQLFTWVVFFFFNSGTVISYKSLRLRFSGTFFSALHRTEKELGSIAWQVTILPPVLDLTSFNRSDKNFAHHFKFFCSNFLHQTLQEPEIKSGSIGWQATILPLNRRCLILSVSIFSSIFSSSFQFFHQSFESKPWMTYFFRVVKLS